MRRRGHARPKDRQSGDAPRGDRPGTLVQFAPLGPPSVALTLRTTFSVCTSNSLAPQPNAAKAPLHPLVESGRLGILAWSRPWSSLDERWGWDWRPAGVVSDANARPVPIPLCLSPMDRHVDHTIGPNGLSVRSRFSPVRVPDRASRARTRRGRWVSHAEVPQAARPSCPLQALLAQLPAAREAIGQTSGSASTMAGTAAGPSDVH